MALEDTKWYLKAAWLSTGLIRRRLYPKDATSLQEIFQSTEVLVGRSDFLLQERPSHVTRSVFFRKVLSENPKQKVVMHLIPKGLCGVTKKRGAARATSMKAKLMLQMRKDIRSQIVQYRSKVHVNGFVTCNLCSKCVSLKDAHVDHGVDELSFSHIAETFSLDKWQSSTNSLDTDIKWHKLRLSYLHDLGIQNEWKDWHRERCKLCMTCKQCNLKQGKNREVLR